MRRRVDGFFFRVIQNSDTIHYFCMKMKGGEESRKFWRTLDVHQEEETFEGGAAGGVSGGF